MELEPHILLSFRPQPATMFRMARRESMAVRRAKGQRIKGVNVYRGSIANSYGRHRNLVLGMRVPLVHSCEHRWLAMPSRADCAAVEGRKVHPVVDVSESTEAKSAYS
jgi:hypothetical protein